METAGAQLQPRYEREIAARAETVLQALRGSFSADEGAVRIEFRGAHAQVSVAPEDARWWSPWLTFQVEPRGDDHTTIIGRFGSNPAFFTLWMMSLASSLVISFSLAMFVIVLYLIGQSPWLAAAGFGVGTLTSFVLAGLPLLGQHYARDQLQLINDKLEACYLTIVEPETPDDGGGVSRGPEES